MRWALVPVKDRGGFVWDVVPARVTASIAIWIEAEMRSDALLAVAKAADVYWRCAPEVRVKPAMELSDALDALRAVMPEFDRTPDGEVK